MKNIKPENYNLDLYFCQKPPLNERNSILIHVGGASYRRLDNETLLRILRRLPLVTSKPIYIIDEPGNPSLAFFKKQLGSEYRFIDGMTLEELAAFVGRDIQLAFAPDGGIAHVFNALTNTLIYFGPGAVWVWRPWGKSKPQLVATDNNGTQAWETRGEYINRFIFHPVPCSPCYDIGCDELHCIRQINGDFCIKQVESLLHCLHLRSPTTERKNVCTASPQKRAARPRSPSR